MGGALQELQEVAVGGRAALPAPTVKGRISVEGAIARRRSVREFRAEALSLEEISQLLWSAQGITAEQCMRAPPSAGACYPLETYLACAEGLFHYQVQGHELLKVNGSDLRAALCQACHGQEFVAEAPVSIIFAAVYQRTTARYRERGIRYVHIDVGHAAENVHLQAVALGLDSVPVGAFLDDAVARVLALPQDQKPIYLVPVGHRRI
jgi:SagB-type dehydrogenase family enzyme